VRKVAIATLGCKVNHYDSAGIAEALQNQGHTIVPFNGMADIYIVNTCTVTGKTDYQSRQLIRRAGRTNPAASIIVTGCYAQTAPEILADLPGVTLVAGTGEKGTIPELINSLTTGSPRISVGDIGLPRAFSSLPVTSFQGQTRAYLKIQDGCNAFCSYCIIPYARGRSRSLPADDVINRIGSLTGAGYREIILTGIHLGMYGRDFSPSTDLLHLLQRIEDETSLERLRISSIEPMEITDDLIHHAARSKILCRHFHIPLQSGDDGILKAMNRHYSTEAFRNRVAAILDAVPGAGIGIDVLAGFPGEGEGEFERTYRFIESLPLSYLHVFPYSRRPGTTADRMPGHVSEARKKERARALRELGACKRVHFNEGFVGRVLSVLVEGAKDRVTGMMKGFSDNYIPVLLQNGGTIHANRIMGVRAFRTHDEKLVGEETQDG